MSSMEEEYEDPESLGAQAEPIDSHESLTIVGGNERPAKKMERQPNTHAVDEDSMDFDSPDDPSSPLNWSCAYKMLIVVLISLMTTVEYDTPRNRPLSLCCLCPFRFNIS